MLVPPTPPTKPTPPVAPTAPVSANTAPAPPTSSPADAGKASTNPVSLEVSGTTKDLEGIRKAFQPGKQTQTKVAEKAESIATTSKPNTIKLTPPLLGAQEGDSAQTTVPTRPLVLDSKPSSLNYVPFVGIVGVVAVVLLVLRMFRIQTTQPRERIDHSKKTAAMNKEGFDVLVPPQTTAPKAKSSFEVRV